MGQLLNRLWKYAQSELEGKKTSNADLLSNQDDELKRIIEELKNDSAPKSHSKANRESKADNYGSAMNVDKAYKILGLTNSSGIEEIKKAYKQKIREYHPDRVENLGDEIKDLAKQKSQQINEAYSFLEKLKGF